MLIERPLRQDVTDAYSQRRQLRTDKYLHEKYLKTLLDSFDPEATDPSSDPWESLSLVVAPPVEKDRKK